MPRLQLLTCQTAQNINRRTIGLSSAIREHLCSIVCRPEHIVRGGLQPGPIPETRELSLMEVQHPRRTVGSPVRRRALQMGKT
ncbi:hypothetical protein K443DRAFT_646073 [Laccaria amethystina LaAM-08-1]|uniref:Unplaced genomic scaffold K443scaffold_311, whole genome shotgun sequence n=1 Tax=Laccaria amethystina LaAM-08-1 TaxID=1095629 RepID=A0A0C9WIR4_9AGAR|nr:hypothetical protein K443DRAFT_646073 [Laccaria amethystina LaAM-08-1]